MITQQQAADDWRRTVYQRNNVGGSSPRKGPTTPERERVIERQGYVCLYCELPIGSRVLRRPRGGGRRVVMLVANWDHFVPYAYLQSNPSANWVLACHVCNAIKSDRMFLDVDSARQVILRERVAKGFDSPKGARKGQTVEREFGVGLLALPPTEKQLRALRLVAAGLPVREIAEQFGIDPSGVRSRLAGVQRRLDAASIEEAIEVAVGQGHFERPPVRSRRSPQRSPRSPQLSEESRVIKTVQAELERLSARHVALDEDRADRFTVGVNWAIRAIRQALAEMA